VLLEYERPKTKKIKGRTAYQVAVGRQNHGLGPFLLGIGLPNSDLHGRQPGHAQGTGAHESAYGAVLAKD